MYNITTFEVYYFCFNIEVMLKTIKPSLASDPHCLLCEPRWADARE